MTHLFRHYIPNNNTEGELFYDIWCNRCERDRLYRENAGSGCDILLLSLVFDIDDPLYPSKWTYDNNGVPICTEFISVDYASAATGDQFSGSHPDEHY